jgi:hypothetical protein
VGVILGRGLGWLGKMLGGMGIGRSIIGARSGKGGRLLWADAGAASNSGSRNW